MVHPTLNRNRMSNKIVRLTFVLALLMQACGDEHQFSPSISNEFDSNAKIKFIHAASDTVGVNLFLDGVKITGNLPSTITTAGSVNFGKVNIGTVAFQSAFPVTNYTSSPGTAGNFSVVFPESYNTTTTFLTKTLSTVASPGLSESSYYTAVFLGISPAYETVIYSDDLSQAPLDGKSYIRFGNFLYNYADPLNLVGTPPGGTPVVLVPNIAYKGMSSFVALPVTGLYTNVQIVNANTAAVVATLVAGSSTFVDNKVYTIFARGRGGAVGTPAPGVTRVTNR
jgi:hypothetical protein